MSKRITRCSDGGLSEETPISPSRCAHLLLALVALNILWRTIRYALCFPIWGDEAFVANNFLTRDFAGMFRPLPLEHGQIVPLGFLWAELAITRTFGLSEWALRLLPFLLGAGSMVLFAAWTRRVLSRPAVLLVVAIFAASYYPVRHGTEIKPYAFDLFLSLVLLWLGWSVYERPTVRAPWVLLVAVAAASVWLSYPVVFVAGGVGLLLAWLTWRHRSPGLMAGCLAYTLVLAASFASMYLLYARPQSQAAPWLWDIPTWQNAFPPLAQPWRLPLWFLDLHAGNMLAYPVGAQHGGSLVTFVLVVVGIVVLWRGRRDLLLLLIGPLVLSFIAAAMGKYPYGTSVRVMLFMAPAFCLLAGVGLMWLLQAGLASKRLTWGIHLVLAVMALIAAGGIVRDLLRPYKTAADAENRRVIRWLAGQTQPGDQWIVFNGLSDSPHSPGLDQGGGWAARFRFHVAQLAPGQVRWGPEPTTLTAPPAGRTWLIAYSSSLVPLPEESLTAYLDQLGRQLGPSTHHHFPLGDGEAIDVYLFDTNAGTPAGAAGLVPTHSRVYSAQEGRKWGLARQTPSMRVPIPRETDASARCRHRLPACLSPFSPARFHAC